MKTCTIFRAAAGSGKSFLAKCIAAQTGAVICEADEFMVDEAGNYVFNPEKLGYCHNKCFEKFEHAIQDGKPVIISNCNIHARDVKPYISYAEAMGYAVQEIAILRSDFENSHNVPIDKVQEMRESLYQSVMQTRKIVKKA